MTTTELLFNSTISTRGNLHVLQHQELFSGNPLGMFLIYSNPTNIIPEVIIEQYNLRYMYKNRHVYDGIRKVMYGLPYEGQIENDFLTKNILPHGYYKCQNTPGLRTNK